MKASIICLCTLAFMSALLMGQRLWFSAALVLAEKTAEKEKAKYEAIEIADKVIASLRDNPRPGIDDYASPVWQWHQSVQRGYTISVTPLSDRLNPNFMRKELFEKTGLGYLLKQGQTAAALQQHREDSGLSLLAEFYGDFFDESLFNERPLFSCYTWANSALIDEFAAEKLGDSINGKGALLRNAVQKIVLNSGDSRPDITPFQPWVNSEALMNIHFVDELILKELLAYPAYGIRNAQEVCERIVTLRERQNISKNDLAALLGTNDSHPLFHYFGSITWFWEIVLSNDVLNCTTIVCRLPDSETTADKPVYTILDRRFLFL